MIFKADCGNIITIQMWFYMIDHNPTFVSELRYLNTYGGDPGSTSQEVKKPMGVG